MTMLISATSIATMLVSAWMTMMYFLLRHPGYQWRAAMAAVICLGAATLVSGRPSAALRLPIAIWGAALAASGAWALTTPADDGWMLIAGTVFVVEGILAVAAGSRKLEAGN